MPATKVNSSHDETIPDVEAEAFQYEDEITALNGPRKTEPKIVTLEYSSETSASFAVADEDHTLGNALRWIILKNPEVELCGYSIPHPAEAKLHIRIQTYNGTTALEALEKGLDDLMDLCDVVGEKFERARLEFDKKEKPRRRA